MTSVTGKRRTLSGKEQTAEVDLTPIMCLFIILVPLLLVTAVFERIAALKVSLPRAASYVEAEELPEEPSGIVELQLLIREEGMELTGTLSHTPDGEERDVYEDIRYELPARGDAYDLAGLQEVLKDLKKQYPRHEEIVFVVDDKIPYDTIVQAMDACREEIYEEQGEKKTRTLFPAISLSERFDEGKGFDGIRMGTREIDKQMGIGE